MPTHDGIMYEGLTFGEPYIEARGTTFEEDLLPLLGDHTEVFPYDPSVEQFSLHKSSWEVMAAMHALPESEDVGQITEETVKEIILWNGTSDQFIVLTGVQVIDLTDASWTPPSLPLFITPETSYTVEVTLNKETTQPVSGDPGSLVDIPHNTEIEFTFSNGQVDVVQFYGYRTVVIPPTLPVPKYLYYEDAGKPKTKLLEADDLPLSLRSKVAQDAMDDSGFEGYILAELGRGPIPGEMYWNVVNKVYRYWNGTEWLDL